MNTQGETLAELVTRLKGAGERSDEDIAQRSQALGNTLSKQFLAQIRYADQTGKAIVPSVLRALADGLDVPLVEVVAAALRSAGLPVPGE